MIDTQQELITKSINNNEGKLKPSWVLAQTQNAFLEELKVVKNSLSFYPLNNWKLSMGIDGEQEEFLQDNLDSIGRHYLALLSGEEIDPISGCHHMAHIRRRCAMGMEYFFHDKSK